MKPIKLLSFLLILSITTFAQRFAIQPGILTYQVDAGNSQTQVVKITNISDQKIAFQAYLSDWTRDSAGGHQYYRADTLTRSCASWVTLSTNYIEVAPKSSTDLLVIMKGPFDTKAYSEMKWAMLFLQTVQEKDSAGGKGKEVKTEIKELMRVGIHIYQTPTSLTKSSATANSFKAVDSTKNIYDFFVTNTGDIQLQCRAYITLTDVNTGQEHKLDKVEFPMFPNGKRTIRFQIPADIPKGKYSALAILDIGEDEELQAIEKTIEVR